MLIIFAACQGMEVKTSPTSKKKIDDICDPSVRKTIEDVNQHGLRTIDEEESNEVIDCLERLEAYLTTC